MGTATSAVPEKASPCTLLQLLTAGALNSYLTEIELQAQALFNDIVMRLSEEETVAENLKVTAPTEPLPEQSDVHQPPLGTS